MGWGCAPPPPPLGSGFKMTEAVVTLSLSLLYTMSISLKSTVKLRSGAAIPQLGYGVYQARGEECEKGVAEALRVGYTHIDSAQAYRNEKRKSPSRYTKSS
jgi:hypothetical protein